MNSLINSILAWLGENADVVKLFFVVAGVCIVTALLLRADVMAWFVWLGSLIRP